MLTNPREGFEGRPHLETELNMVDDFLKLAPDYFPPYFIQAPNYKAFIFSSKIKTEYRLVAFQMILMDFINYIHIYGQQIIGEAYRGTDRGLIFDKLVGENIQHTNLLSTSTDIDKAKPFGERIMIINTNGQKGLVINKTIRLPNGNDFTESEILFPPCQITKTSENQSYKGKLVTRVILTNLEPPMTNPSYRAWFMGDWNYYKTHSYFSTWITDRFGGRKKRTKKRKKS
jgi:hypothetical protein